MAKPTKDKTGLHKNVSSVLKGVPIPQGVCNWRPPNRCGPDQTDDSSAVSTSNISSVFKGVSVATEDVARPPAAKHPQNNGSEASLVETPNDRQTSESDLVKNHDCPEESLATDVWTEQPEFVNEVVHYRDPTMEPATRTLGQWIQDCFSAPNKWIRHLLRHSSTRKR